MNIKQKVRIKMQQINIDIFSNQISLESIVLVLVLVLVYTNQDDNTKRFKTRRYYLPKSIIKNYNVTINGKKFYDQPVESYIKQYEKIRKLTTRQGEDYTTGCLLDYVYIKILYRLIVVNLSRQKELDADPKAIQQIEFIEQLKNVDGINADGTQDIFILTILKTNQRKEIKISQGSVTIL